MSKETRDFNVEEVVDWVIKHNLNNSMAGMDNNQLCIISKVPPTKLNFPDGWYYNRKNGLTNKHNSTTGLYHCIKIHCW